jgi:predicted RNA polymerase sigma factor
VELNRAVAVAMASGPDAGLQLVEPLRTDPALKSYHLLPAVRGDLLFKLKRFPEAGKEFELAASLTRNTRERNLLLARAAECGRAVAQ